MKSLMTSRKTRAAFTAMMILAPGAAHADYVVFDPSSVAKEAELVSTSSQILSTGKEALTAATSTLSTLNNVQKLVGNGVATVNIMRNQVVSTIGQCIPIPNLSLSMPSLPGLPGCAQAAVDMARKEFSITQVTSIGSGRALSTSITSASKEANYSAYGTAVYQQQDIASNASDLVKTMGSDAASAASDSGGDLRQQMLVLTMVNIKIYEELLKHRLLLSQMSQMQSIQNIKASYDPGIAGSGYVSTPTIPQSNNPLGN